MARDARAPARRPGRGRGRARDDRAHACRGCWSCPPATCCRSTSGATGPSSCAWRASRISTAHPACRAATTRSASSSDSSRRTIMANETTQEQAAEQTTARNFDLLLDIPLEVTVELGRTRLRAPRPAGAHRRLGGRAREGRRRAARRAGERQARRARRGGDGERQVRRPPDRHRVSPSERLGGPRMTRRSSAVAGAVLALVGLCALWLRRARHARHRRRHPPRHDALPRREALLTFVEVDGERLLLGRRRRQRLAGGAPRPRTPRQRRPPEAPACMPRRVAPDRRRRAAARRRCRWWRC